MKGDLARAQLKSKQIPDDEPTQRARLHVFHHYAVSWHRPEPGSYGGVFMPQKSPAHPAWTARLSHPLPCLPVVGKTEGSLPVKLELSFGAPIPSTADSNGGERRKQGEKREKPQLASTTHKEVPAREASLTPGSPSPTPPSRGCRRMCLGTKSR